LKRDLACALALLVIAGTYYGLTRALGQTALSDVVGPAGLPTVYATVLAGLGVSLAVLALLKAGFVAGSGAIEHINPGSNGAIPAGRRLRRAGGAFAIGIVYIAAMPFIGYAFATALAIGAMAAYQGERTSWRLAITACAGAGLLYLLFDVGLGVDMPAPWKG
jgi:hypothetical protein